MGSDTATKRAALGRSLHLLMPRQGHAFRQSLAEAGVDGVTLHSHDLGLDLGALAVGNSILVIEAVDELDLDRLLSRIEVEAPDLRGIVLGQNLPVRAVRSLLNLRHWQVLDAPDNVERLIATALSLQDAAGAPEDPAGRCWTFLSSVGGAGSTLLAVETAYQLGRRKTDNKVCLVDLNFFDGACASYLNCQSNLNLDVLNRSADRMDLALLQAFLTTHKTGIHVLSSPRRDWRSVDVAGDSVLRILDIACSAFDHVIVDLPRWPTNWSKGVLAGTDEILLVSELTVPALHAARLRAEEIEEITDHAAEPRIILNRMSKRVFGHSVTVPQAEDAIGRAVYASIQSDWDSAVAALNIGQPVSLNRPASRLAKDVGALIARLEATEAEGRSTDRKAA